MRQAAPCRPAPSGVILYFPGDAAVRTLRGGPGASAGQPLHDTRATARGCCALPHPMGTSCQRARRAGRGEQPHSNRGALLALAPRVDFAPGLQRGYSRAAVAAVTGVQQDNPSRSVMNSSRGSMCWEQSEQRLTRFGAAARCGAVRPPRRHDSARPAPTRSPVTVPGRGRPVRVGPREARARHTARNVQASHPASTRRPKP